MEGRGREPALAAAAVVVVADGLGFRVATAAGVCSRHFEVVKAGELILSI